jgi:tetratricopeptide (TPR) repeat protein
MANRPNTNNRPNANNPGLGNRPAGGERPGAGNRANVGDRANVGNRASVGDRANIGNQANIGNRANVGNRANIGNNVNINRPMNNNFGHNQLNHGDWYHGAWHGNWNHGWYNHPAAWWGAGLATGLVASAIPWSSGYYSYSNPYYTTPVVDGGTTIDYSQPILAATPPSTQLADAAAPNAADQPTAADQASQLFDAARDAFKQGNYQAALSQVDQAIGILPNDPVLHEFRGLVLFATNQYKAAAEADYAVLSAGPGWDWTTLSGLYPSVDVYTQQLRALEAYCKQNPNAVEPRFLLAYQYLTCGSTDAAETELKAVVRLNPKDQLSAQLLAGLAPPPDDQQQANPPSPAAAPAAPVGAASLAGKWQANRPDGSSITLDLAKDLQYSWMFAQQDKKQELKGSYTVADNLLVLNQDNNPAMVGQVTPKADRSFNFKLVGAPPSDPGITFNK